MVAAVSQTFAFTGDVGGGKYDSRFLNGGAIPQVPQITVTGISASQIRVALSSYSADTTTFRLDRSPNGTTNWTTLSSSLTVADFPYVASGLSAATTYYFRLYATNAFGTAGPSTVRSASTSSSGVADGSPYVVNAGAGEHFGTVFGTIEYWGGAGGFIDTGTVGNTVLSAGRPNWVLCANYSPRFSNARTYSRSRSVRFNPNDNPVLGNDSQGTFGIALDTQSPISEIYTSAVEYWDKPANITQLQWKVYRWGYIADVNDGAVPNCYLSNWYAGPGDFFSILGSTFSYLNNQLNEPGMWVRIETFRKMSTGTGVADGVFRVRITNANTGAVITDETLTGRIDYPTGQNNRYRYFMVQHYLGNASPNPGQKDHGDATIDLDDLYISHTHGGNSGAYARVEVSDGVHAPFIQPFSSWGDQQIVISGLNQGALSALSGATLRVYNSSNTVVHTETLP